MSRTLGAVAVAGATGLAWGLVEAHAFTVRRATVPVLPRGADELTVLHVSDLHLTPSQRDKIDWVASLADAENPDLVVVTGDNLAHHDAVPAVAEAFAGLFAVPGLFVFGSNDYWAPRALNPFRYFGGPSRLREDPVALPTEKLRRVFLDAGWHDMNNARAELVLGGLGGVPGAGGALRVTVAGLDDPHIGRDRMPAPDGERGDLHLGVVHAPYARALSALAADNVDLTFAGHTHGGQVCVPFYGALVTNCDLDAARVKGLSRWPGGLDDEDSPWLHVSAGLGTSPFAPVRFACRPEATVLTLVERD